MVQGSITISSNIDECILIENCLMYYHAGYEYKHLLCFHALANSWKYDRLMYYINLIEDGNLK